MKVTEEMIYAFNDGVRGNGRALPVALGDVRAGLEAVFRLIDPVPENVNTITDGEGDEWIRSREDRNVWIHHNNLLRTYRNVEKHWGPITWESK